LDEGKEESNTFFAVYDGHGGGTVAKFAGQNVHRRLVTEETYHEKEYEAAMKRAFLGTDEDLRADPARSHDPSGCTAIAALITHDNKIYVANAGDSRSVISVKGESKPLSFDHKPGNDIEKERIYGAGGYIECGRVNGNLALSRALGDFEFKKNTSMIPEKQMITADPDVLLYEISEEDEFLVIACDGIWDCLSSQDVVDFVRLHVSEGKELVEIGELMCEHCLAPDTTYRAGVGCDNMTVLIVAILHGRSKEEWYNWVTQRVKDNYGYETPSPVHQIYAQARLAAFKVRREAQEARERARQEKIESDSEDIGVSASFGGVSQEVENTGGISFHPSTGIVNDNGTLMFTKDESDDDDSGDDFEVTDIGRLLYNNTSGIVQPDHSSATYSLKSRLDAFEQDTRQDGGNGIKLPIDDLELDNLISSHSPPTDSPNHADSSADGSNDPPPKALPNGVGRTGPDLLNPRPGDEPSPPAGVDVVMQPPHDGLE